jgi:outer membrane protein assembly factor BamB
MMKYKFTNTLIDAQIDSTGTLLGVLYMSMDETVDKLLLLSIPEFRPIRSFTVPMNTRLMDFQATCAILGTQEGHILFQYNSIEDAASYKDMCAILDRNFVTYEDDFFTVREKATGTIVWKQKKENRKPDFVFPPMDQDHLFWLNDGLWCASIPDSTIWYLKTSVISKNYAAMIVRGVLGIAVSGAFVVAGSPLIPIFSTSLQKTLLCSNPFVEKEWVYFASEDSLSCLKLVDGKPRWQRKMQGHRALAYVWSLDKDVGVLVEHIPPSFVEGFSLTSGDSLWRFDINRKQVVKDEKVKDAKCYLLTNSVLYVIGSKGESVATLHFNSEFRPSSLLLQDSIMLIFGERQVAAWKLSSDGSVPSLWEKNTGKVRAGSLVRRNYVWFLGDNDSLTVINIRTGQTARSVYLPYDKVLGKLVYDEKHKERNYLLLKSWKDLGIIQLDSLLSGLPDF